MGKQWDQATLVDLPVAQFPDRTIKLENKQSIPKPRAQYCNIRHGLAGWLGGVIEPVLRRDEGGLLKRSLEVRSLGDVPGRGQIRVVAVRSVRLQDAHPLGQLAGDDGIYGLAGIVSMPQGCPECAQYQHPEHDQ